MDIKKLKLTAAITGGVLAALYAGFLVLPYIINLNNFIPVAADEIEKISGFKLNVQNPKIKTTFRLGAGLKADNITLSYKDNTPLISLKEPEIEINLPSILIGHINLDKIKADELDTYLVFTKSKKYTVAEYIDNILKNTTQDEEATDKNEAAQGFNFPIKIQNINIKADRLALHLLDENTDKTYLTQLNNSSLRLKSLNGPLSIKTSGFTGIENTDIHFADINIDLKTKLPKITASNANDKGAADEAEISEFNINPFKTLEDFNLRTKITTKLNIKNIEDFKADGDISIQNFSLKLGQIQLPESYLKLDFKDRNIDINSKLYASKEEFLETKSTVTTGKKQKLDLNVKTEKITLKSLKDIIGAILDICLIENDIKNMTASGYIKGNFNLDTNFKTIKSNGELKLAEGNIKYAKAGLILSQMKAFLDFSDNALTIKDTSALVNGAKFSINGEIASNADINLKIKSDPLKIKDLVNIATEFKMVNKKDIADFEFKDGALTVLVDIIGDLSNIKPKADIDLNKFNMLVKSVNMPITIEDINIIARPKDKNDIDASVKIKNAKASISEPQLTFILPNAQIAADMANIIIEPASATLEGTKINVSGDIKNYMKTPELNIKINGSVHPSTVLAFIPKEFRTGITHKGQMPYNAFIAGTVENIKITGSLITNPSNYISIIEMPATKGKENILNLDMALKNDILDLNDIHIKTPNGKLATLKGQVKNIYNPEPVLSGLNISIPNKTNVVIIPLAGANFNAAGDITLSGKAFLPDITGNINIDEFKYPDFGLTLAHLVLNFNKNILNIKADGAKVANSDFSGDAAVSTNFTKGVIINNLNYNSNYIDSDALIALADKVMKSMPSPASQPAANKTQTSSNADLGVDIKAGNAKIAKLKSGTLYIENINYAHTLLNNIYNLNNLNAWFAQGTANGKCTYNVINGKITVDMKAENISMKEAAKAFIGIDIVRSGTLGGNAKVSLSGATFEEQMKTLNGAVNFEVKDGEYGENISFVRFINAANVLNLNTFSSILSTITAKVNSINTQEFKNITGVLTFNNGVAGVTSFKSQGPNMSLYANGTYGLLNNNANLKITGRVSQKVATALGNLGINKIQSTVEKVSAAAENTINKVADTLNEKFSDNKTVQTGLAILGALKNNSTNTQNSTEDAAPAQTQSTAQKITSIIEKNNPLFGTIPANDTANIPALSEGESENTKVFQVVLNGPIASPKSIKSLKFQNDNTVSTDN